MLGAVLVDIYLSCDCNCGLDEGIFHWYSPFLGWLDGGIWGYLGGFLGFFLGRPGALACLVFLVSCWLTFGLSSILINNKAFYAIMEVVFLYLGDIWLFYSGF